MVALGSEESQTILMQRFNEMEINGNRPSVVPFSRDAIRELDAQSQKHGVIREFRSNFYEFICCRYGRATRQRKMGR